MINTVHQLRIAEQLFDCLPDVVFFQKDVDGFYLTVNETLLRRCGLKEKSEIIGRRPSEVLGQALGQSYERQDKLVLSTGRSVSSKLELHAYANGMDGWCITNKQPLFDGAGQPVGIVGVSQDLRAPNTSDHRYQQLSLAIEYVQTNLSHAPDITTLAKLAGLSPYQLDQRMQRIFGLTTGQWVLKQRLDHACQQLTNTTETIAHVAFDAGYEDQGAFTRQFRLATGLTPSKYRQIHSHK